MSRNVVARPLFQVGKGGWLNGQLLNAQGAVLSNMPQRSGILVENGKVVVAGVNDTAAAPIFQESGRGIDTTRAYFTVVGIDENVTFIRGKNTPDVINQLQKLMDY